MTEATFYVEIAAGVTIPISVIGLLWYKARARGGLGVRIMQFIFLCMTLPLLLILGIEKVLDGAAIGTLLGGASGYLLANIGKYDENRYNQKGDSADG